ncbi:MAG: hypothetical protein GY906_37025 [bacterium]|nr:hypothetical protein [bacterium]
MRDYLASTTKVPPFGPTNAAIMGVGEAPGGEEIDHNPPRPFVGKSGQLLGNQSGRAGIPKRKMFLTNLSPLRPKGNKFVRLIGNEELTFGLEALKEDILRVNPKVIIAFGGWPMYYLTGQCGLKNNKPNPGSGILARRGSVYENTLVEGGPKVLCTLHPAYVYRTPKVKPFFVHDLGRAKEESLFRDIRYPPYELLVDPPDIDVLVTEAMQSEWISFDIETFGPGEMSCFGFTFDGKRAIVLTFQNPYAWQWAKQVFECQAKKIAQYGTYDCMFLEFFYGWKKTNFAHDTYIGAANLEPGFPKGLDFLTSINTTFAFYKEERKEWKKTGDYHTLWDYNAKDVISTWITAMTQMEEIRELYG